MYHRAEVGVNGVEDVLNSDNCPGHRGAQKRREGLVKQRTPKEDRRQELGKAAIGAAMATVKCRPKGRCGQGERDTVADRRRLYSRVTLGFGSLDGFEIRRKCFGYHTERLEDEIDHYDYSTNAGSLCT